jgi:F-type H+-transporting ATPase subunit b
MRHTQIAGLLSAGAAALAPRLALAAEAGAQPGIINLDVTLIIQAVNFLILILLLSRFLFRPLTEFLRNRAEGIQRSLDEATAAREAAARAQEEHRAAILAAQREGAALREQAQRDVETERQRLQAAARAEAERMLAHARDEIAAETRRARAALREEAVTLSVAMAERLLGRAVTSEDQRRLAEQYIRELGTTN